MCGWWGAAHRLPAMSDFLGYLHDVSGGAQQQDLPRVAGVGQATVSRWNSVQPSASAIARIARHYRVPVAEVMVAAGYLDVTDARPVRAPLSTYSHVSLLRELERRLAEVLDPDATISSPAQYGEEPTPDDFDLAAGDIRRPADPPSA